VYEDTHSRFDPWCLPPKTKEKRMGMTFETDIEVPEGKNVMVLMSAKGDTKSIWDSRNPDEVEMARKQFDEFKRKGFLCYKTDKKGEKAEQVHAFDATAERLIFSPPLQGG
jgi:hypothetical protein